MIQKKALHKLMPLSSFWRVHVSALQVMWKMPQEILENLHHKTLQPLTPTLML